MTLLVTGSNGLLGHALQECTKNLDVYFATREDADLTDFDQTSQLFEKVKPSRVIHLAALVGGIGSNSQFTGQYFLDNLRININVLDLARIYKVRKLVSFMSTCVFPEDGPYPLRPQYLHNGPPHKSNFGYAYAKRMLQVQSAAYRKQWDMNYVIAIPSNMYGPHDNFKLLDGHVIPSLIHKVYLAKSSQTNLEVWGTGNPLREFIYCDDVAKLTLWMLDNYNSDEPLILTTGHEISIKNLVINIAKLMDFQGKIIFNTDKPDGQFRKPSDGSKLLEFVNKFKFVQIEDGLDLTISWFTENYHNARK